MFTIKFYSAGPNTPDGYRQVIRSAESFTILHGEDGSAEITLHQKDSNEDQRFDIDDCGPNGRKRRDGWPPCFERAIIENAAGKTTEMIHFRPAPTSSFKNEINTEKDTRK